MYQVAVSVASTFSSAHLVGLAIMELRSSAGSTLNNARAAEKYAGWLTREVS